MNNALKILQARWARAGFTCGLALVLFILTGPWVTHGIAKLILATYEFPMAVDPYEFVQGISRQAWHMTLLVYALLLPSLYHLLTLLAAKARNPENGRSE